MRESFLFLAEGFEEIEALTCVDVLRRAGIPVRTVSISSSLQVIGAHGVEVTAEVVFNDVSFENADWLILPGGMPGALHLYEFEPLRNLLKSHAVKGGNIAAICAAPAVVLGQMGLLEGRKAVCYPGFEAQLKGSDVLDLPVLVEDGFVLANGPANALKWALSIVKVAAGEHKSLEVAGGMLLYPNSETSRDFTFG